MTDPTHSLARALADVCWGQGWKGMSPDARTLAIADARHALTLAARDIAEAIAEKLALEFPGFTPDHCHDCHLIAQAIGVIKEWRP